MGAALQGGSWSDIAIASATGGLLGAAIGTLDPSLGVGTLAIIGGVAGGVGDIAGQLIANRDKPCKSINWWESAGAVAGGAISGGGAVALGGLGTAAGLSEGAATAMGASITSGPSIFLPSIGVALGESGSSESCGCLKESK